MIGWVIGRLMIGLSESEHEIQGEQAEQADEPRPQSMEYAPAVHRARQLLYSCISSPWNGYRLGSAQPQLPVRAARVPSMYPREAPRTTASRMFTAGGTGHAFAAGMSTA